MAGKVVGPNNAGFSGSIHLTYRNVKVDHHMARKLPQGPDQDRPLPERSVNLAGQDGWSWTIW